MIMEKKDLTFLLLQLQKILIKMNYLRVSWILGTKGTQVIIQNTKIEQFSMKAQMLYKPQLCLLKCNIKKEAITITRALKILTSKIYNNTSMISHL